MRKWEEEEVLFSEVLGNHVVGGIHCCKCTSLVVGGRDGGGVGDGGSGGNGGQYGVAEESNSHKDTLKEESSRGTIIRRLRNPKIWTMCRRRRGRGILLTNPRHPIASPLRATKNR